MALYPGLKRRKICHEIGKELFFHVPSLILAERMTRSGKVYVHQFEYAFPVLKLLGAGAAHCTNSALTAGVSPRGRLRVLSAFAGEKGKRMGRQVHSYWCSFIASGDPNEAGLPFWPEYGQEQCTMILDADLHVEKAPFQDMLNAYGEIRIYGN